MRADAQGVRAAELVESLVEGSAEVREAAIFAADGTLLAASSGGEWVARSAAFWAAVDRPGSRALQVNVGIEDGEVFGVREAGLEMIVVADRFVLSSLVFCDARAALRAVASPGPRPEPQGALAQGGGAD